jgi:hypothetical protein
MPYVTASSNSSSETKNTKVLKMEKSVSIFGNGAEPEKQTT